MIFQKQKYFVLGTVFSNMAKACVMESVRTRGMGQCRHSSRNVHNFT